MSDSRLVYVGMIKELSPIENADFIESATVVCGEGGKWRGIVKKGAFELGNFCLVYLPDAVIPECEAMAFMKSSHWRVKMRRFRGAPSEVVIMPYIGPHAIGFDITSYTGVTKYHKPVPANLQGKAKGPFPGFIPKTDELNYQMHGQLVEDLQGFPYYITEKADGSSTTAYRYKGEFGVCSRNWELEEDLSIGYWEIAERYKLKEQLPEGIAIQWETCGPKIQSNPMGLSEIAGFVFSAYDIHNKKYLEYQEFKDLCHSLAIPMVRIITEGCPFKKEGIELLGEGQYSNGKEREGVVVRSMYNFGHKPISFKVINLNYEK